MTHSLLCSVDKHCAKESHEPHPDMWKHQSFEWLRPQTLSADRRARWIITSILLLIISWTTSLYYSIPWPARQSSSEQNSFGQSSPLKTTPADVYPLKFEHSKKVLGAHGLLPIDDAREFCQRHRLETLPIRNRSRKVYDLFLINTELDWFEIRLNELGKEVDYFIVLESATTFQGNPKSLYLQESLHRYHNFQHKIIHRVLDNSTDSAPIDASWDHESFMRNALFDQVILSLTGTQAPNQGDVLIVGDIDEIPRPGAFSALRNCAFPARTALVGPMYYYSYQWQYRNSDWTLLRATYFKDLETVRPQELRTGPTDFEFQHSMRHCSSCFETMGEMKTKVESFSHLEFNVPEMLETDRLLQKVRAGLDLFGRDGPLYDRVDDNPDIPFFLRSEENRERFAYMPDRDPPNGNFRDL